MAGKSLLIQSKLPDVGTTIFSVITAEAQKYNAINLAQGFPEFDCDPQLKMYVGKHMMEGKNQYAPMPGLMQLREAISSKFNGQYDEDIDGADEVTITAGATQGLFTAIASLIEAGDEVIIIEPAYDSYSPAVRTFGGTPVYYSTFAPDFKIDFDELASFINAKTKMIILNNPGNPSTKILSKEDLDQIAKIVENTNIVILSDEVYEHLVYDDKNHYPTICHPVLKNRTISVYSFGKTFHNTGWKVGYCVASKELTAEFRKIHQFNVFCVNSFVQHGLADYITNHDEWKNLPSFYQSKRDLLSLEMKGKGYEEIKSEGSFFSLYDYSNISKEDDQSFVRRMIRENKIAAIPLSSFYGKPRKVDKIIRLCFAKDEGTLVEGARRLQGVF